MADIPGLKEHLESMSIPELTEKLESLKTAGGTNTYKIIENILLQKLQAATAPVEMKAHAHTWFDIDQGSLKGCSCGAYFQSQLGVQLKVIEGLKGQALQFADEVGYLDPMYYEAMSKADENGKPLEQAIHVDEPNTYGVDIGKPGGDKTVVAHIMGQKVTFHESPGMMKDSMIEFHGKLYVATNLHQDKATNEFTLKAQAMPDSVMLAAVEKEMTKSVLSAKGLPKKPNKWSGEKWTAEEVIGPALVNEQAVLDLAYANKGSSPFLALETIAEGAKLYLYGPKMVTSQPKQGQIIHIGYACHSVLQGEKVWVSKVAVPSVPEGTGSLNIENLGVTKFDETTITMVGSELCTMAIGESAYKTGPIGTLQAQSLGGSLIRFTFVCGGVTVGHKALLAGPDARVRARHHLNPDGSSTYFLEHAPDTSLTSKWECLNFQQASGATKLGQKMTETMSANLMKSGGTGVVFNASTGRKLMEFASGGKIIVYGDTFFSPNGKTVDMMAQGFAKEFWSAVEEHNPLKVELKVEKAKLGHVMAKIKDITQAYEVTQETLKSLLAEKAIKNYDPKADPAMARFSNVADMLDMGEQSE
jgi:hypothetical protein